MQEQASLATFGLVLDRLPARGEIERQYHGKMPGTTLETLLDYLYDGVPMGDFCNAVVKNDLMEAIGRADHENIKHLRAIATLVYSRFPGVALDTKQWIGLHHLNAEERSCA